MNFLPASVTAGVLRVAGMTLALPADRTMPDGELKLGVRPEYVVQTAPADPAALPFQVTLVQDIGTHMMLTATLDGHAVKARLHPAASVPQVGEQVWLRIMGSHTCLYVNEELVTA